MMSLEHKGLLTPGSPLPLLVFFPVVDSGDTMQRNYVAPVKGFQSKDQSHTLNYNITNVEDFPKLQDGLRAKPGGKVIDPDQPSRSEPLEYPEKCIPGPYYHHEYGAWLASQESLWQSQMNVFQGQLHPFAVNYGLQYTPTDVFAQSNTYDFQFQDFQYFVVIDFEATCDKDKVPHPQEIIEFPSVIVNSLTGQLEACFQTYVRPTCNKTLSAFCKDLTGIQQFQVDRGVTLSEALTLHDKWLESKGIKNSNFAVVTWSNWDCQVMLESECRFKNIRKPPYFNRWINLRVPFSKVFGTARCNLKEAVEKSGLSWEGRAHCGLDDAKNTARLLAQIMHKGYKFSITNSLSDDQSSSSNHTSALKATVETCASASPPLEMQAPVVQYPYCYCGVRSSKCIRRKPGPKKGSVFFGCGNWTASRGAVCPFFEWEPSP